MREIKFRAWDHSANRYFIPESLKLKNGKFVYQTVCTGEHILEQFTGLHDKSGKEIYEGDIVKRVILKEKHFKVVWDNKYSCFMGMDIHDDSHDIILSQWELEIIGNIYENQELLEVVK
jgi:uncharacterized phage protein (TIGR01671 family)